VQVVCAGAADLKLEAQGAAHAGCAWSERA
jgi:hypothetical protein